MAKSIYIDENGNEQILSSSPSALSGLLDTDITTPTANQVLAYDNNGKVVNHTPSYADLSNKPFKKLEGTGTTDSSGIVTSTALGITQLDYDHHNIISVHSSNNGVCVNVGQYNKNFYYVCTSAAGLANPIANTSVTIRIIYIDAI